MKKLIILIIILILTQIGKAQDFQFRMYFEDAIGNKDTLTIGYDRNATDSIDALFDEINIISTPLNEEFDVRITNESAYRRKSLSGSYHSKKQIVKNACEAWNSIIGIEIYAKHWPVTVSWDNSLFNDGCRKGSVFTSMAPGGWWDVGSPSDLGIAKFDNQNQVTFSPNYRDYVHDYYAYINDHGDTISYFWQAFFDADYQLSVINKAVEKNQLVLFPNPITDQMTIKVPKNFGQIVLLEIISSVGQSMVLSDIQEVIDLSFIDKGLYILVATNDQGEQLIKRFEKE